MVWSSLHLCGMLEFAVMLFQIFGVVALCVHRLLPETRWAERGKNGYIIALIGLGIAGALCGPYDSEFALFAGGTMTVLLIGMTIGSGPGESTGTTRGRVVAEPNLAS
jgi:hypothetical protein